MKKRNPYGTTIQKWIGENIEKISVTGVSGSARTYLISELMYDLERPLLIILPRAKDAIRFLRELEFFLPDAMYNGGPEERRVYDFPIYDISPLAGLSPHRYIINRRIQSLYALTSVESPIIITSLDAILLRIMPKHVLLKNTEYLEPGEEIDRDDIIRGLETGGYLRTSLVEELGDYSVRGGVIDIYPPLYSEPVRLDFWGDHIESIRTFDPVTQRSTGHLDEITILPANEIIMDEIAMKRARSMGRLPDQITVGNSFPGQEAWLNHFYAHPDTFFDYFPAHGLVACMESDKFSDEGDQFTEKMVKDIGRYHQEADERGTPYPETDGILISSDETESFFQKHQVIEFNDLALLKNEEHGRYLDIKGTSGIEHDFEIHISGKGRVSMAPLAERISEWLSFQASVILVCRTEQQAGRLKEILENYEVEVKHIASDWDKAVSINGINICLGRLSKGFAWPEIGLYVVSEDEIFGPKRTGTGKGRKAGDRGIDWTSFSQLKVGDLIVHEEHGIGKYGGLVRMEIEDKTNDFVLLEYAGNDRLYIPADRISILQKYLGSEQINPKLDRLGGKSWDLVKKKAKRSVMEIARQLVEIYALRKYREGFAFSRPDSNFKEFEATFEHEETPDQVKAIDDVLSDMESERPMDRLICGDVGFGKTEVAIRAAYKAVMDGKQAAMLVPTTVLAEQHYETFRKRMEPYNVKTEVLSRFKGRAEQREIIAKTRSGKVDILIGTHRLLQKDISFKDLGLLIVDEEQRFGVKQKEGLKKYRALVDVLAMTATPIPRTLHMSLMGVRDLSIIETPPEDRLAIQTFISAYDETTIKQAIVQEINRGGQIFFVHNRVRSIEKVRDGLARLIPDARIAIAHGQMKERELEDTMMRFIHKEIDVLVCTTIIESGLDIPSSNTIIINEADHFGLSQIYQLRGRVGRSTENAYAYLLLSKDSRLSREAEKRLKALMDFSNLGAGIHLAMHDLKIRGGGNILGFSQSGHIAAIGYELYQRFIEQAIAELKGEEWYEDINPEINVDIPAYLPEEYIADVDVRLNLYRRLSGLNEEYDLQIMTEEIEDRFGSPPVSVANLLKIMKVRLAMKKKRIARLDIKDNYLIFNFSADTQVKPEKIIKITSGRGTRFRFLSDTKIKLMFNEKLSGTTAFSEAESYLKALDPH